MSANYVLGGELALLTSAAGPSEPSVEVAEVVVLAACGLPNSRYTLASEIAILTAVTNERVQAVVDVAELVLLTTYVSGPRDIFTSRAWGFTLDNHPFYVLHLGQIGTYAYDLSTGEWSNFSTEGVGTWNMEVGVAWNGGIYAGDNQLPTVWRLNPDSFLDDDFKPIIRTVTGGIPQLGRVSYECGAFSLIASPQTFVDGDTPTITLSFSDDNGRTFRTRETLTVTGESQRELEWRSLGMIKRPGRVYRIVDSGGLVKLGTANQEIKGEKGG